MLVPGNPGDGGSGPCNLSQEGVSPAQRSGLWAMRGSGGVAELTFKAMRLMNKGSWTSGQEGRSQNVWVSPQSREKGVFGFLLQFPLYEQKLKVIHASVLRSRGQRSGRSLDKGTV